MPTSTTTALSKRDETKKCEDSNKKKCHFNSISSIWYCLVTTLFTVYLVYTAVKRFLLYTSLPWRNGEEPFIELNALVGLVGAAIVVMPFFIVVSILKVGNLANDGGKLGSSLSACSRTSPAVLNPTTGVIRNLWLHGVPTGPFLHLVAAFCFFLPKILMDASLVQGGFLPIDDVWKTDMDPLVLHNERHFVVNTSVMDHNLNNDPSIRTERAAQVQWSSEPHPNPHAKPSKHYSEEFLPNYSEQVSTEPSTTVQPNRLGLVETAYWKPFSAEIVNYVFALCVFAVRYPSVFWNTSKTFSFIFSMQLIINAAQTTLTLCAFSILYKIQMSDPNLTLYTTRPFLLAPHLSLLLMVISLVTITASSTCLYMYGYQKFTKFVCRSKQRFHISYEETPLIVQPFTAQIFALITLIVLGLSYGPLLWDMTTIYKGSLDAVTLSFIVGTIGYIFLWVILWIVLTIKSAWVFKLRVTVARAFVSSARSIKLVNDIEMMAADSNKEESTLLVVGSGKAYAIQDESPQNAIMDVVETLKQGKKDDVYWLRSKKSSKNGQPKVRFSESVDQDSLARRLRQKETQLQKGYQVSDDGGDYAFLASPQDSESSSPDNPRYVDRRQILAYREAQGLQDMSPPSPILVAPDYEENETTNGVSRQHIYLGSQGPMTSRHGLQPESQSQRSDSISSTVSTNTPQENSEESGIHSGGNENYRHRSNSVDDLSQLPPDRHRQPVHPGFPHVQRPPQMSISGIYGYCKSNPPVGHYKVIYPSNETTMAIKRQRNLTQEIKPPVDPIYGTRKLTSFTDSVKQTAEKKGYVSPQSTSSGYQSTNSSTNSAGNSPVPSLPLPPISECSNSYSPYEYQQYPPSHNYNFSSPPGFQLSNPPQLPLPPIPHSLSTNPGLDNLRNEIYGRAHASQSFSGSPKPIFSQLNRSTSLRLPQNHGNKQYTNTLPHVLPKDSFYNTNV